MSNDISESVSQRGSGAETPQNRRIYEVANELHRRCQLYEAQLRDGKETINYFEVEQRVAEQYAKENAEEIIKTNKKISPMGRLFEYKCKSCGYTVNANPKGHDAIMMGEQYTYHCEDCKEIVYVVCPYDEKPKKAVCPECGSENLKKWNPRTGKCPICGDVMEKTDIVIMVD